MGLARNKAPIRNGRFATSSLERDRTLPSGAFLHSFEGLHARWRDQASGLRPTINAR